MNKAIIVIMLFLFQSNTALKKIVIDPSKDKEKITYLSEIAKKVEYIKLETTSECYITNIAKLIVSDSILLIKSPYTDYNRLLMFNVDGGFIKEIGSYGRGPGECLSVFDFTVNKIEKLIYILDSMGKFLVYDYSGKYIKTVSFDSRPTNILYHNGAIFLFNAWPDYSLNNGFGITIMPTGKGEKPIYLLNRKSIKAQRARDVLIYANYFFGVNNDNSVSFFEAKFDTLYNINTKFQIQPKLVFQLVNDLPRDLLTTDDYRLALKKHNTHSSFLEVNNFLFFTVITPKPSKKYLYTVNKLSGEISKHYIDDSKTYIYNDVDGGLSFNPQGVAEQGVLYSTFDCYQLKEYLKDKTGHLNDPIKLNYFNKLVQNSDISDNPIIMLVTVK
jgi:hypothetical protein